MTLNNSDLARYVAMNSLATRQSRRKGQLYGYGLGIGLTAMVTASIMGALPAHMMAILLASTSTITLTISNSLTKAKETKLTKIGKHLQNMQPPSSEQEINEITTSFQQSLHDLTESKNYVHAAGILKKYREIVPKESRAEILDGLKKRQQRKLMKAYGYEENNNGFHWLRPQRERD
jgi:hypothetical protein